MRKGFVRGYRGSLGALVSALLLGACGTSEQGGDSAGASANEVPAPFQAGTVRQGLGPGPDFEVTQVSGPSALRPSEPLWADVTLCNTGDTLASTELRTYLSVDGTITRGDLQVDTFFVSLEPGACQLRRIFSQNPLPEGEWVLGALADPFDSVAEGSESNNARAGGPLAIGYKPDLVLTEVRGPASTPTNSGFTVTFTACNQGTVPTTGSGVEFYQSPDATITPSDMRLGGVPLPSLAEGECITRDVQVSSPGPTGAWFLGAIADPFNSELELFESNNTRAGESLGVGSGPDLVVRALSAPRSAYPGRAFDFTATVCNQGTAPVSSAPLEVLLSLDGTIDMSDSRLTGVAIPGLLPGECREVTASTNANVPHGVYVLGALVDPGNALPELIKQNNAFAGPRIGVGDAPDLVVASVRGPPNLSGGSISGPTAVTVCNWGTVPTTSGFHVDLVQSWDATFNTQDRLAGGAPFPNLAPNECASRDVSTNISGSAGTWFIGAIIDAAQSVRELSEDNNTGASARFGVGPQPDYVIQAVSGPPVVTPGGSFPVTVTLCNEGASNGPSDGSPNHVQVVRSADTTIDLGDRGLGSLTFPPVPRGECVTQTGTVQMAGPSGPVYLGAIVDVHNVIAELFEDNNTRVGNRLGVGYAPELVVRVVGSPPPSAQGGQSISAKLEVCNQGTQATSASISVDLFQSMDGTVTAQDRPMGGASLPQLAPGECRSTPVSGSVSGPDGLYTLGAIVDAPNFVAELLEDNNLASSGVLAVGLGPDYVVSSLSGLSSVQAGQSFPVQVTVCNHGTQGGPEPLLKVFQSSDAIVTGADPRIAELKVPTLMPGQCRETSLTASALGPNGIYTLGAIIDPGNSLYEIREDNNVRVGGRLGVGSRPDLVVTQVSGPTNVPPGASFTASVRVCNQGSAPSGGFNTDVALSQDTTLDFQDVRVGGAPAPGLNPGQCTTLNVQANAHGPSGPRYLGAITDSTSAQDEMFEDNNTLAGSLIGVGSAPDLLVTAFSSPGVVVPGALIRTRMTVCNQGTQPSPSHEVAVFQSGDATVSSQDFFVGNTSVPTLAPGQCVPAEISGPTQGSEGSYVLGALADPQGQVAETLEGNNLSTTPLVLGFKADLTVTAVSGPATTRLGSSFTAQVTACNLGTKASLGTTAELRLSTDDRIGPEDSWLTDVKLPEMGPGQCLTFQVNAPSSSTTTEGLFWLGARVNPKLAQEEARDDNNTLVGNMLAVSNKSDLTVTAVTPPTNAVPLGASFSASVRVCNVGQSSTSTTTRLMLVLSADNRIALGEDIVVADVLFDWLAAGACRTQNVTASTGSVSPGTWVLGAVADASDSLFEANELNNALAGEPMAVGNGPDLLVSSLSAPPANAVLPGSGFSTSVLVCNRGSGSTPPSEVGVFLSRDATISRQDFFVGSASFGSLSAGTCLSVPVSGPVSEGTWFVGAIADPNNTLGELREDNNARAGASLVVGSGPNLLVTSVSGPGAVRPGASFTTSVTVCNRGSQSAPPSNVSVHVSGDASLGPADLKLGETSVPGLSVGGCITLYVSSYGNGPEGALFTLGAIVDPGEKVFELREDDNAGAGGGFRFDGVPPATPSITSTSPNVQGTSTNPTVNGTAEASATVRIYTNNACTGTVAKTGTASTTGSFSISVPVTANSTTTFYAQAVDAAGNVSGCSAGRNYTHDGIAPSAPVLSGTNPASPGTSTTPAFQGTAEPNATVRLYTTSTCTGTVAASGSSGTSGSFSLMVTVAANTTTTVYASSTDAAGNVSGCSAGLGYTHSSL